jgi:hypothetical protein
MRLFVSEAVVIIRFVSEAVVIIRFACQFASRCDGSQ